MKAIITGGAGFIGSNAASRYLQRGDEVIIIDNLSRPGTQRNLNWLKPQGLLSFYRCDIRNSDEVKAIFNAHDDADLVLHLAGQVAVTTSLSDPLADFETNALGTLNILEAARFAGLDAPILYASTNKVYGGMEEVAIMQNNGHYAYSELCDGVNERQGLDFHSPYGCSKGAADQYVRDYARIYGLNTVVFRQSCIYGYRQFGVEDQGWVAWFIIAAILGKPIVVYGDGKQVRDILFIDDLLDAYDAAVSNIKRTRGQVYNIGGGPHNVMSLRQLITFLGCKQGRALPYTCRDWRKGDQRVYVSNISKAKVDFEWSPKVCANQGLTRLYDWVLSNRELFA